MSCSITDLLLHFLRDLGILDEEEFGLLAALADRLFAETEECAGFLEDVVLHPEIDHLAFLTDAGSVDDVELGLSERWSDLVLHNLHAGPAADHFGIGT